MNFDDEFLKKLDKHLGISEEESERISNTPVNQLLNEVGESLKRNTEMMGMNSDIFFYISKHSSEFNEWIIKYRGVEFENITHYTLSGYIHEHGRDFYIEKTRNEKLDDLLDV